MLPAILVDFLERASVAVAATRNRQLVARVHWVSGWAMDPGDPHGDVMSCLISRGFGGGVLEALGENGRFALTAEVIGPHETYQFKGEYVDTRPVAEADEALYGRCRERFVQAVRGMFGEHFSIETLRRYAKPPELVVRFRVREVFVQTPGPAAGRRLFPPEDP